MSLPHRVASRQFTQACLCDTGWQLDSRHSGVSLQHRVADCKDYVVTDYGSLRRDSATQGGSYTDYTSFRRVSAMQGGNQTQLSLIHI